MNKIDIFKYQTGMKPMINKTSTQPWDIDQKKISPHWDWHMTKKLEINRRNSTHNR